MSTIAQELQQLWEQNRELFPVPPRRVQIQKAGDFYRARYEGESSNYFGRTEKQAIKSLKFAEGER